VRDEFELSIVKAIVEAHGDRIKAYNANIKGAVFELQQTVEKR
jgi:signal transduction histidine kinase